MTHDDSNDAPWFNDYAHDASKKAEPTKSGYQLLKERFDAIASGKMRVLKSPWAMIDADVRLNLPGTLNVLCGDPGSAKSFFTLQLFMFAMASKERACIYELEETKAWHMARALAQLSGEPRVTDMVYVQENADRVAILRERWQAELETLGGSMVCPDGHAVCPDEVIQWADRECKAGARIIGIDPITALLPSSKPWIDDQNTMTHLRRIVDRYHASVWIVTHPKKGRKLEISMDVMAGGAAMSRFANNVLWLERTDKPESHVLYGGTTVEADRILHVCKCRDGLAAGRKLSMTLRRDNLTFVEHGWIKERRDGDTTEDIAKEFGL
jgi:hypothetical protein